MHQVIDRRAGSVLVHSHAPERNDLALRISKNLCKHPQLLGGHAGEFFCLFGRVIGDKPLVLLEEETKEEYGADVTISGHRPQKGVKFGYALNLSICVGCRKCSEACHL